ncbi:hypothetical protein bAD24_p00790 (plasmid) [Burkholderia sp. AD24]|nr:hypothetical protein bAD24_p00790 [Burkholderia sp. AD24]
MGMFDHVTFRHRMPDGYQGGDEAFQTKDLRFAMDMASYEVTADGKLVRTSTDCEQPLGVVSFNNTLTIDAPGHTYALSFSEGVLRTIHCFQTELTVPFSATGNGA